MNMHEATRLLIDRLGPEQVLTDEDSLYQASMDNLRYSQLPAALIKPADEDGISEVLKLANTHQIPLTTRGAGSATTGAATPVKNGWVLDLSGWKNLHIDPVARMAFVQPGVTLEEIEEAANAHGLTYPPDPGSKAYATIGGTIATNAGGMRGAKYGVTRDYVISLEGFLPAGQFVRWGGNLRKFSAGYNIRDLWIGSEGTLGIITGAVVKLLPKPAAQATCLAVFDTADAALACSQEILRSGQTPSALEFLDSQTIACTFNFWKTKAPELIDALPDCLGKWIHADTPPSALLIEVDGRANEVNEQLETLLQTVSARTGDYTSEIDSDKVESLWKLRRSCSQAMFELGPRKLNEDVVVPFDQQSNLISYVEHLHPETGLATPTFGHAADGNFHVHIMYDDTDSAQTEKASKAIDALMKKVVEMGGAISGEHGIGLAKSPFFHYQHAPEEIEAMQAIKAALDPNDILNPGKLWHPCEPWNFTRENVKMPWDH
jgi:glycolate oxidase